VAIQQGRRANHPRRSGLPGALAAVDSDATLDGFPLAWSRTITWLPILGTLVLGAIYVARSRSYYWLLVEDHPVEWAQFGFLVFACLAALLAAGRLARQSRYALAAILLMVALGSFLLAGEEISWGERVFSLAAPADLASINKQHEINLHNLNVDGVSVDKISQLLELVMGLGGALLALLARPRRARLNRTWLWNVAPPLLALPGFGLMALYQTFMLGTGNTSSPAILYQEWMEFCFYLCIAITAACCWTRAAAGRYRIAPAGPSVEWQVEPGVRAGLRPLVAAGAVALALTAVFAQMSAQSHVLPGNVPPSLVSLYGSF
jgi:hypothetical protein